MPRPCTQLFGEFDDNINKFGPPPTNVLKQNSHAGTNPLTLNRNLKWTPKTPKGTVELTVKFLEKPQTKDPEKTINAIKAATKDWEKVANIKFIWKDSIEDAVIRIAFRPGGGYNSLVGTTHLNPDIKDKQDQKTMNLDFRFFDGNGNPKADDDTEIYSTTLHEFGHAIGCVHEQVNPDTVGKLVWKPEAVYTWFSNKENQDPPWEKAKVDLNFNKFEPMAKDTVLFTKWDGTSIMQYFILKEWTSNLKADIPEPTKLSEYDKEFIREMYPFPPK